MSSVCAVLAPDSPHCTSGCHGAARPGCAAWTQHKRHVFLVTGLFLVTQRDVFRVRPRRSTGHNIPFLRSDKHYVCSSVRTLLLLKPSISKRCETCKKLQKYYREFQSPLPAVPATACYVT